MHANEAFEPIRLVDTNVINKKGYYSCEIVDCSLQGSIIRNSKEKSG